MSGAIAAEPASELVAKQACQPVIGDSARCVFDVRVTGNPAFATTYVLSQSLQPSAETKSCNRTLVLILGGLLLLALILLLILWLRR
jgi:hypothetical protein